MVSGRGDWLKEPFWNMTYTWPDAYYIAINPNADHTWLPKELKNKGMVIHEDISKVLEDVLIEKEKEMIEYHSY